MKYKIGDIVVIYSNNTIGVVMEIDDYDHPFLYRVFLQSTLAPIWVSQVHMNGLVYRPQSNSDTE
jgi:hypothetical protein